MVLFYWRKSYLAVCRHLLQKHVLYVQALSNPGGYDILYIFPHIPGVQIIVIAEIGELHGD